MNDRFLTVKDITLIAVFVAVITVCSWISIPVGPVPVTLQTFAIFTTGGLLGTKRSLITIFIYIMLGMVGVPVFTQFKAGPNVLAGPTGGYVIGFIFTVIIIGTLTKIVSKSNKTLKNAVIFLSMILGDIICFAIGTVHFMFIVKVDLVSSLTICVIPYIIPDLVKMIIAIMIINRVKKYI